MASGEHSCTRRDLLGAAFVGVGVLVGEGTVTSNCPQRPPSPSHPPSGGRAPPSPEMGEGFKRWYRALAGLRRAEGRMRGAEAACSEGGLGIEAVFAREEAFGDRIVAFNRALSRLLAAPAPDLCALAVKIGFAADYEAVTLNGCEQCLRALKADAVRLAGA